MIVMVYWPFLHEQVLEEIRPRNDQIVYWIIIVVHIWPFLAVVANVAISQTLFIYGHYRYLLGVGVVYMFANFIGTKAIGRPLYHIMPWEDSSTLLVAIGLIVLGVGSYLGICYIVNTSKTNGSKYR